MKGAVATAPRLGSTKNRVLRPAVIAACVLGALMASGCAEPPAPAESLESAPSDEDRFSLGSDEGAIEGVVVDTELRPLVNVTVQLEESSADGEILANTTTDEGGAYAFRHLAPAVYRVRAILEGFGETSTLATVTAGQTSEAGIVLDTVPSADPYVAVEPHTGLYRCAVALVLRPEECDPILQLAGLGGESPYLQYYAIGAGHQAIVIETYWEDQETTMDMWAAEANNETQWWYFGEVIGTPILRVDLRPGQIIGGLYEDLDGSFYGPVPESDVAFTLSTETSYIGEFQETTNSTLFPVCQYTWGYCTGVGVALDFRFEQYVSVFYHAAPDDLSGYSALPG